MIMIKDDTLKNADTKELNSIISLLYVFCERTGIRYFSLGIRRDSMVKELKDHDAVCGSYQFNDSEDNNKYGKIYARKDNK